MSRKGSPEKGDLRSRKFGTRSTFEVDQEEKKVTGDSTTDSSDTKKRKAGRTRHSQEDSSIQEVSWPRQTYPVDDRLHVGLVKSISVEKKRPLFRTYSQARVLCN